MGIALNRIPEGATNWLALVEENWDTLEDDYLARQGSDTSVVTVTGTTAETALMANTTVPANGLQAGRILHPWAAGSVTIPASSTPSVTWRLRWGGISGTVLASWTWNFGSSGSPYTVGWIIEKMIACVSAGASGSVDVEGWISVGNGFQAGLTTAHTTIDTTAAKTLLWTVQLSLSTVSVSQRLFVVNRS
jgi:hypothetical protein